MIREAIERERERRGWSHWRLAKEAAAHGVNQHSVLNALPTGTYGVAIADACLRALGLKIVRPESHR